MTLRDLTALHARAIRPDCECPDDPDSPAGCHTCVEAWGAWMRGITSVAVPLIDVAGAADLVDEIGAQRNRPAEWKREILHTALARLRAALAEVKG